MPLALELAAARVKVLTPAQILERLGRSLELLTAGRTTCRRGSARCERRSSGAISCFGSDERALFAALGVFAGSFDVTAAEAVCGADLAALASVLEQGLVRRTEDGRFLLATLREFAPERLSAAGDPGTARRDAHLTHYLGLARDAWAHLGDAGPEGLARPL